ncbi:MAG: diaminopimelate epimerase [Bacillota bacterium]|nr:diaminopimelate epimerase [Bacillota bacterium]
MKIEYIKANPTENKTILVKTPVPRKEQAARASELLREDPDAEQVGFLEPAENPAAAVRLQMMGGEFCGNASISAAAFMAERSGIKPGETRNILLEVSGADEPVECMVCRDDSKYIGTVDMPLPSDVREISLEYEGWRFSRFAVFFPGIVHIIFERADLSADYRSFAEKAIKQWAGQFEEEAVGLILLEEERSEITPLVYVKSTDSLYWERGCGTGTAAAGVYLSCRNKASMNVPVKQPGGIISAVTVFEEGIVKSLKITGGVYFENEGFINK